MAKLISPSGSQSVGLSTIQLIVIVVITVPIAYVLGRFAVPLLADTASASLVAAIVIASLASVLGLAIGLSLNGAKRPAEPAPATTHQPQFIAQQDKILAQLCDELAQNKKLFESRQGNAEVLTRIDYITSFWTAVKASGQLFVMQEPRLLKTIATAYYWLEQANRLEGLAYEAQYKPSISPDNQNASTHLIAEARLLDGPLSISLQAAIDGIAAQLQTDKSVASAAQP